MDDEYFMRQALIEAQRAYEKGEVPVGAVVVYNGVIIARAHNLTETLNDVTAHAEIQAITAAANSMGGKYLKGCTLYVTLEPCIMCAGAIGLSQVSKVVYGVGDSKRGYSAYSPSPLHPKSDVKSGILAAEALSLLQSFFESKRKKQL